MGSETAHQKEEQFCDRYFFLIFINERLINCALKSRVLEKELNWKLEIICSVEIQEKFVRKNPCATFELRAKISC